MTRAKFIVEIHEGDNTDLDRLIDKIINVINTHARVTSVETEVR